LHHICLILNTVKGQITKTTSGSNNLEYFTDDKQKDICKIYMIFINLQIGLLSGWIVIIKLLHCCVDTGWDRPHHRVATTTCTLWIKYVVIIYCHRWIIVASCFSKCCSNGWLHERHLNLSDTYFHFTSCSASSWTSFLCVLRMKCGKASIATIKLVKRVQNDVLDDVMHDAKYINWLPLPTHLPRMKCI